MVSSVCGGNQVWSTKTSVSGVWGCMSAASTGELQIIEGTMNANMYCDILKQSMIPSLRRLAAGQYSNTITTTTLLAKQVSKPKPYWASVGHPQTEGGGAHGC